MGIVITMAIDSAISRSNSRFKRPTRDQIMNAYSPFDLLKTVSTVRSENRYPWASSLLIKGYATFYTHHHVYQHWQE